MAKSCSLVGVASVSALTNKYTIILLGSEPISLGLRGKHKYGDREGARESTRLDNEVASEVRLFDGQLKESCRGGRMRMGFSHYLPSLPLLLRFELRQRAHLAFMAGMKPIGVKF
jgi:hypothetical protein